MFGLFKPPSFNDPELGAFAHQRGLWRGTLTLTGTTLPLAVAGTRSAPAGDALAIARQLPATWSAKRERVARALIEHLTSYQEAGPSDAATTQSGEVWQYVELQSASVTPLDGKLIAEIALTVSWDEEHILGARFEGAFFVELNGSIIPD